MADLLKLTFHSAPMVGGAVFCFVVLIIFYFFKSYIGGNLSKRFDIFCNYGSISLFIVYITTGFIYLFYPNYLNHVEPMVASLGVVLKNGDFLYPMPVGVYPYSWSLYGPALFEMQAVFQWVDVMPTIVNSKLPGFIALLVSAAILMRIDKGWLYRGYLLYLFPFGLMLFWNRAEPHLVMIVSLSLLLSKHYAESRYLPILMGFLGGAVSALKMHGAVYVFAAYLAVTASSFSISSILLFIISTLLSFLAFFIPHSVLFSGFWGYLNLVGFEHDLSLGLWMESLIYLLFLLFPFIILRRIISFDKPTIIRLALILTIEFLITIVASKQGNGFYHLLPLIPINAFIIQKLSETVNVEGILIKILYVSLIAVSLIVVLKDLILPMAKSWQQFDYAQKELVYFEKRYPDIMMGVTDEQGYPYSFLRAIMKKRQIDYASFMDLQIAEIKDDAFAEKMKDCEIKLMLLPNIGEPFMLNNYYTLKPLFSDNVRAAFKERYNLSENGKYYSVYTCSFPGKDVSQKFIDH